MTSSSPRKRPTIVSSSARRPGGRAGLALALALVAVGACRREARDPLITYFNGDFALTLQHPASWKTQQAEQDGVWYRSFLAPPVGPQNKPAVSVTLLAGPLKTDLDAYAQPYLAGNTVIATRPEHRPGLAGKSFVLAAHEGDMRYTLLLLAEQPPRATPPRAFGLYAQGAAADFERYSAVLDEITRSLALERPEDYAEHRDPTHALALRIPRSWHHARRASGGGMRFDSYTSPAIASDKDQVTIHAALTVAVEPAPRGLDAYYSATRQKLGENYAVVSHSNWKDGYVDVMHVETPMSASQIKRFYRVSGTQGYSLSFEVRGDVYARVSRWFDFIADTLKVGPESTQP